MARNRLLLGVFVLLALASMSADPAVLAQEGAKKVRVASIVVKDAYADGVGNEALLGAMSSTLRGLIERIDTAAKDKEITAVVLRLREPSFGLATAHEIRAAVGRARKAGKRVVADVHAAGTSDYLVASACDEIIMPESGMLLIPGLEAQIIYYKGLFDKVGIEPDFIQVGDFKGASEAYTRTNMSPEFRQQFEAVINDYYEQIVETIAEDRKLDADAVRKLIDRGMFTAEAARSAGLVDKIAYEDQWKDDLKKQLQADELVLVRDYAKKKGDTDLSSMTGLLKMLGQLTGADQALGTRGDKIAVVYAVGEITTGESAAGLLGDSTLGSDTLIKALRQADEDPKVKGIVLRVDSPGGSALASDLIWRTIEQIKKPLVVSMGETAASGGYYISMGAKKIFVEPGTLTGSIGVISGKLAVRGLFDKVGLSADSVTRGKTAGLGSITNPFSAEEREAIRQLSMDVYGQFTRKAAAGRHMELAKLESLAAGRLYSGRMAVANGLADKLGTLDDAVAEVKQMAGVKPDDKIEMLILPKPRSIFDQLLGGSAADSEVKLLVSDVLPPELLPALRSAATLQRILSEPATVMLPFIVRIR